MNAGLQLWDEDGNLMFDSSTIVGRFIAVINASGATGSATVPGLDQGIPFAVPQLGLTSLGVLINTNSYPICTFDGNLISWTRHAYPTGTALPDCMLILGVR